MFPMAAITNYPNGLKTTQTYSLKSAGRGPWVKVKVLVGLCSLGGSQRDPVPDLASLAGHSIFLACSFCSPLQPLLSLPVSLATPSPTSLYKDPYDSIGLPRWLSGKESTCQCRRHRFNPWVGKIPWRRKWQPTPVFFPGEFQEQRILAGYSPWGRKELDTTKEARTSTGPT